MKDFKEYFKDELRFLKEDSKSYAKLYPRTTRFLTEETLDPDVERILESFAFLSAKINKKIDDDFPELTNSLINLIWPEYVKPVPSFSICQFNINQHSISETNFISKNSKVLSAKINNVSCPFYTTEKIRIDPLKLESVTWQNKNRRAVDILFSKNRNHKIDLEDFYIRLYLNNNTENAGLNYKWLFHSLKAITISLDGQPYNYDRSQLIAEGFNEEDRLITSNGSSFDGFRLLQEYFCYRERFNFIRFTALNKVIKDSNFSELKITLIFDQELEYGKHFQNDSLLLNCTSVINLFELNAIPLRKKFGKDRYPIIPQIYHKEFFDIYDITSVEGSWIKEGKMQSKLYSAYEDLTFDESELSEASCYKHIIENAYAKNSYMHYIDIDTKEKLSERREETITMSIRCTNREIPSYLGVGDINQSSEDIPSFISLRNITKPSNYLSPINDADTHWLLINYFSLNYLTLKDINQLKKLLMLHDRRSMHEKDQKERVAKLLESLITIESKTYINFIKGISYRGIATSLKMQDTFEDDGEIFVFCTVLSNVFAKYSPINFLHKLSLINASTGENIHWQEKEGDKFVY